MSRSLKKGPFVHQSLLKKIQAMQNGKQNPIKTWSRSSTVIPEMIGFTFLVHNGKDFMNVFIVENMVGHKLGEFAHTRKFKGHGGRMAKEQAAAAVAAEKANIEKAQSTTNTEKK